MLYHSQGSNLQSLLAVVDLVEETIDQLPRVALHHGVVASQDLVVVLDTTWSVVVRNYANLLEQSVENWIKNGLQQCRMGSVGELQHLGQTQGDFY